MSESAGSSSATSKSSLLSEVELFHFILKRFAADLEALGRLGDVSSRLVQRVDDVLALDTTRRLFDDLL